MRSAVIPLFPGLPERVRHLARLVVAALGLTGCRPASVWQGLSPDHRTSVEVSSSGGRSCVAAGSRSRECYDGVALHHIEFSTDSRHLAYPVQEGSRWFVVRDGIRGLAVEGVGELVFSPNGRRLAYSAERDGAWYVVVDDRFIGPFESLLVGSLVFDVSGDRLAFVSVEAGRAVPVVDGIRGRGHDGVASIAFSPDGRRVSWVARDADRMCVVLDGVPGTPHDVVTEVRFSPTGGGIAYIARDADAWWIVHAGVRSGPYAGARHLAFLPVTGTPIFTEVRAEGERVVMGGSAGPAFSAIDPLSLGATAEQWGYVARDSLQSTVVIAGGTFGTYDHAGDLVFGAGARFAYLTRSGEGDRIVHDRGVARFDMVVDGTLQFLPDGSRWAGLVGDLSRRRLWVTVEGERATRPFSWSEFVKAASSRTPDGEGFPAELAALRAWVAAEAAILAGSPSTEARPPAA